MRVPDITPFSQITESLYLTSYRAITEEKLRLNNISHVINISDLDNVRFQNLPLLEFTRIEIADSEDSDIFTHLGRCADKIQEVEQQGGRTLVHCVMGISRSATVCIAFLMKHRGMSLRKAYFYVKARRSVICPNLGFWAQMVRYEEQLFGSNTVELLPYNMGYIPSIYRDEGEFTERWALRQTNVLNIFFILLALGLYDFLFLMYEL